MVRLPFARCVAVLVGVATFVGCDSPLSMQQRILGEWVGQPETAAERVVREWPRPTPDTAIDPADEEVEAAVAAEPPTDLEAADVTVTMQLKQGGVAEVSLADKPTRIGKWTLEPIDSNSGTLEIEVAVEKEATDADPESPATERRRFDIEFLPKVEKFVLRESGADRLFGRLLFTRPDADALPSAALADDVTPATDAAAAALPTPPPTTEASP